MGHLRVGHLPTCCSGQSKSFGYAGRIVPSPCSSLLEAALNSLNCVTRHSVEYDPCLRCTGAHTLYQLLQPRYHGVGSTDAPAYNHTVHLGVAF